MDIKAPKKIYLQLGDTPTTYDEAMQGEVSWCDDKIYEHDIEYILADEFKAQREYIERLEVALKEMQYTYPYSPPCLDWEVKVRAHRIANEALASTPTSTVN